MTLYEAITAHLVETLDIPDEYDPPDRFYAAPDNEDIVVSGVWSRPLDPEIKRKQEELREYVQEHDEPPPKELHDAATPDPDIERTRREQATLPDRLATRVTDHLTVLETAVTLATHTHFDREQLVCTPDDTVIVADIVYDPDTLGDGGRMVFDALARTTARDNDAIPSADAVTSVDVHLTGTDTDDEDGLTHEHDYTVWFETPNPHDYWGDVDSVEEYCEMVADNNDDADLDELLARDTYGCHVHLYGSDHTDPVVEAVTENQLARVVELADDHAPDATLRPSRLHATTESLTLRGGLTIPVDD